MNRQRRRRIERDPKKFYMALALCVPVHILHQEYGWGSKKRCPEVAEKILETLKEIAEGKKSVAQLIEEFEALTGMKID